MAPDVATLSVLALALAILLSCTTNINVGLLSIALAWFVGTYAAHLSLADVLAGFPSQLFLTLVGVTFFFTEARNNGTLDKVAHRAVGLCRGQVGTIPIMFFALAFVLAAVGPGSIASAAIIAPMAMAVAGRTGIPAFLMALMVANGSSAASLSPFGATGLVVKTLVAKMGLVHVEWRNFLTVMLAHTTVGMVGYFVFGGWRLFTPAFRTAAALRDAQADAQAPGAGTVDIPGAAQPFEWRHWLTIGVVCTLIVSVLLFEVNVGMGALVGGVVLVVARAADEGLAIRSMPWGPILMVSGVTVLVALLEKTGGIELFSTLLARASTPRTINGFAAFVTGVVSIYSSTAGVVLPAFLPTVPGILQKLGGGDPMTLVSSMLIGAHLVDVSPLSTTGALCIAAAAPGTDVRQLFRWMMAWGISMAVVAAVGCYLVFGVPWPR
ncbi:MAG: SLC13 family permease [Acidobacteriota bacterium]